jgi:hypothetical protein
MKTSTVIITLAVASAIGAIACGSSEEAGPNPADNTPQGSEEANVASGELAVQRRKCVECHNSEAGIMAGRTTPLQVSPPTALGETIEVYPPNLTNDPETGIGNMSDALLAGAIRTGFDRNGLELCKQMKHFAEMSDFEVYSIIKYLRSLPAVKNVVPRSVCPPLKWKDEQSQGR